MSLNRTVQTLTILSAVVVCFGGKDWSLDEHPQKWNDYSKEKIDQMLKRKLNGNLAKNSILFLGDGMGVSTVTAGRILKGQLQGENGEEHVTVMESLDHVALSKTYNINAQTADSAGTATAYFSGVKTRIGSIGVDGRAIDCPTTLTSKVDSLLDWAHKAGKAVGIVTTTRITHATPAGTYANIYFREMEAFDGRFFTIKHQDEGCKDIAAQLIEENSFINLVFGGGRRKFLSTNDTDPVDPTKKGDRIDRRNLLNEWELEMKSQNLTHKYVWDKAAFDELKPGAYDRILGLFNWDHMEYKIDKTSSTQEPTLSEMTTKAIQILSRNPNGYFLMVEGGRIDHGHHAGQAQKALTEFVEFDLAISEGLKLVNLDETLVVVTADHSHVFTIGSYNKRGNDLFGLNYNVMFNTSLAGDNLTYTPLLYANGPGKLPEIRKYNLTAEITANKDYFQEAAVLMKSETHGGEDVAIYASGPMSYLFDGTVEQSHIAHVMAYSSCIGLYNTIECRKNRGILASRSNSGRSNSVDNQAKLFLILTSMLLFFILI